ncbi:MAG: hypothetical protein JRD84_02005 [Deltaproteobacteria bacterium]|nr:hypothetical protein [Deltaproteobacteria bacterium]
MLAAAAHFNFAGLIHPVAFINSESLYPLIKEILRDWGIDRMEPDDARPPVITIQKTEAGFERRSKWLSKPAVFSDPVDAACDLVVDLIHSYVAAHRGMLCLHCAAVKFNQGLVVFPNTYRAGKSTLSLKLAESGERLFTDDVLPISNQGDLGLALGILPRIRLPLPEGMTPDFVDFVTNRAGPQNSRYLYAKLGLNEQAALGTSAPINGVTILQREKNAKAALMKAKKSIVVKDMILRNFARQNPGLEIIDRVYSIVDNARCHRLIYDNLDQAVSLLEEAFG